MVSIVQTQWPLNSDMLPNPAADATQFSKLHDRITRTLSTVKFNSTSVTLSVRRRLIIIIIIIAPLTIVKEDQWGDLEGLHKACQAAINDGGLFTDNGADERCENERQDKNDCEMKTVSRAVGQRTDKS